MPDTVNHTVSAASDEPNAKRRKMEAKKFLKDLPADEFISVMNECLEGSRVITSVDGVEHSLPKNLVCSTSSFFDYAFNGNFREGDEQKMELKDVKKKSFDLVVQWMFTGQIVLPTACDGSAEIITELVGFFELADRLDIMGPFDSIIGTMRSQMCSNRNALLPQHIRDVAKLPRTTPPAH
ncbi:hypothetical protein LSUB1_G000421 [Lachnellula subtilissima]|uniref:BTB domain-containing protein n=1 Tax=Lachnellula subtilissima TaxID=602034 RepID=A0A8H8S0V7_9HELO|nr:hypothetical protein LSUB1_G000421 [Lachnellula subtilissima]